MSTAWKNFRIRIFNWLGAGKVTLKVDQPQEYTNMGYTLNAGATNWSNGGIDTITLGGNQHNFRNTITIKVTPATGGHIVSVDSNANHNELHIIPEGTDFDRELGKIITLNRLKA
jgi:hypothetical protein